MARKHSLKDSVYALLGCVVSLCLILLTIQYVIAEPEKRTPRKTTSRIPFIGTKITRGDHSVLHVVGTREQVEAVKAAHPDADITVSVEPTKKSVRQIHTEIGEGIKSELFDISDAMRSIRQR